MLRFLVDATITYNCYLTDEDEQIVKQYCEDNDIDMTDSEELSEAIWHCFQRAILQDGLYTYFDEVDCSTEDIYDAEFEDEED